MEQRTFFLFLLLQICKLKASMKHLMASEILGETSLLSHSSCFFIYAQKFCIQCEKLNFLASDGWRYPIRTIASWKQPVRSKQPAPVLGSYAGLQPVGRYLQLHSPPHSSRVREYRHSYTHQHRAECRSHPEALRWPLTSSPDPRSRVGAVLGVSWGFSSSVPEIKLLL